MGIYQFLQACLPLFYSSTPSTLYGWILVHMKAATSANSVFAKHVGIVTRRAPGKGYEQLCQLSVNTGGPQKRLCCFYYTSCTDTFTQHTWQWRWITPWNSSPQLKHYSQSTEQRQGALPPQPHIHKYFNLGLGLALYTHSQDEMGKTLQKVVDFLNQKTRSRLHRGTF